VPQAGPAAGEPGPVDVTRRRFPFEFSPRLAPLALSFGVTPSRAYVEVTDDELRVRFGPWSLRTPRTNVRSAEVTGPYKWWKVAGPAHLSMADGGVTFATTTRAGVCISFREPVPALMPGGWLRHIAATVTVATPHALVDLLSRPSTGDSG
jgi:hypothetical protein